MRCGRRLPGPSCSRITSRSAVPTCASSSPPTPTAASGCRAEGAGLYLDFSKNRITDETLLLLGALAQQRGVVERREAMFAGEHINVSEDRAVLHVALRMPRNRSLVVDGVDVVKEVHETLDRMAAFCERVRSGEWRGHTGKPIRAVVNIGIGGSDLGPVMAYEALKHYAEARDRPAASSPTSTAPTSPRRPATSTPRRRSSSSPRRPSPRWRR